MCAVGTARSSRTANRATIPHKGTFKLYITKDSYDPSQALAWSTLEQSPFLTATDPPLRAGAYVLKGALPAGKSGRHLIYTIWQTSDTPDTYYSCSDVDLAVDSVPIGSVPITAVPIASAADAVPAPDLLLPIGIGAAALLLLLAAFALRRRRV